MLKVAHKATDLDEDTPTEFITIQRGYEDIRGERRWRPATQFPYDSDLISWLLIGLDITRLDHDRTVPEDAQAVVVSRDTAQTAFRELDSLIDGSDIEAVDRQWEEIFQARKELRTRLEGLSEDEPQQQIEEVEA